MATDTTQTTAGTDTSYGIEVRCTDQTWRGVDLTGTGTVWADRATVTDAGATLAEAWIQYRTIRQIAPHTAPGEFETVDWHNGRTVDPDTLRAATP